MKTHQYGEAWGNLAQAVGGQRVLGRMYKQVIGHLNYMLAESERPAELAYQP